MIEIKVLVADSIAETGVNKLKEANFEVDVKTGQSEDELVKSIKDYDAVIIRSATKITKKVIGAADKLKVIGRAGIGLDNVDVETATKKGVIVANAPESNTMSAAEHTIALILAQARKVPQASASLKRGKWDRKKFQGVEVADKVLGIIGLGKIGTIVASRAKGLGMRVAAHDPYVAEERFEQLGIERAEKLDDLLKEADFLTVHLPKTKETMGFIGKKEFSKMKDGVRVVNTSRGGIIDEKALAEAVKSGKVASAGVDVFPKEPCTSSPLFKLDQVVVTPHLGASTYEAQDRAGITIAEQVITGLKGEFVSNAVNIAAPGVSDKIKPFLPLAEKIGRLFTHISEQSVSTLEIEYAGTLADYDTAILTVAILKGLFSRVVEEPVTYVNAPLIAKERGIDLKETRTSSTEDYTNVITLKGKSDKDDHEVSVGGTLVGKNQERFISIFDFDIDMIPSEYMAFFRYEDRPGRIGLVGTILGEYEINIANMQVGRRVIGGEALMCLNVDTSIPESVMDKIKEEGGITYGKFIVL